VAVRKGKKLPASSAGVRMSNLHQISYDRKRGAKAFRRLNKTGINMGLLRTLKSLDSGVRDNLTTTRRGQYGLQNGCKLQRPSGRGG